MLIEREMEFPGALATITGVDVSKKLEAARIRISVIPSDKAAHVFSKLEKARGKLQFLLNRKLNIKPMPRIIFEIDPGPENAAKVEKALLGE